MNCLIVIPSLRRAGAEAQAVDLANGLVNCGHVVHIFTFAGEDDQKDRLLPFIKLHHYPRHRKLSVSYIVALRRLLDDERIDVIYG